MGFNFNFLKDFSSEAKAIRSVGKGAKKAGSNVADFGNAVVDRGGGSVVRGGIRLGAFLSEPLPGEQRKAAKEFINKYAENEGEAAKKTGIGRYNEQSAGGKLGRKVGTVISAGTQIAGIGKAANIGKTAGVAVSGGEKAATAGRVAANTQKVFKFLGSSVGGSIGSNVTGTAQGRDVNIGKDIAVGVGLDLATAGLGKGAKLISQQVKPVFADFSPEITSKLSKADTPEAVRKILGKDTKPEIADAISRVKDPRVITNILKGGNDVTRVDASVVPPSPPPEVLAHLNDPARVGQDVLQPAQDIKSATVPNVTAPVQPAEIDPFDEILGAVHGKPAAKGQAAEKGLASKVAEQERILSEERGARFAQSAQAGKSAEGSQGYFAEKGALKGEYSKVNFEPLVHDIGPERAEELFTSARQKINATPDDVYHELGLHPQGARLNTQTAVRKVLGLEPGLPTRSELKLLGVYSPKLAEEAKKNVPVGRRIFDAAATIFGSARSAKSTLDLSMGGRQGLFVAARHPVQWAKANAESIKYAKSSKYYKDSMRDIHDDEWGKLIDRYNPSVLTGGAGHEEAYAASDILTGKAAKKAGVGHLVAGSERAYTGGLTKLRKDILTKSLSAYGATAEEVEKNLGPKGVQGLIEAVSTLTGRGGKVGGFVSKHATTLQEALFSPRLWASRLQPLNPAFWKRIGPAGRKEALQSLGSFAAVAGVVLGAAAANGADVETDPRSSDFLKIKVGDTRYDILGGFQQNLVFGARQLSGTSKSSSSGKITKYGEGFGAPTRLSAAADLVRNKANPVIGSAANILEGKDKAGNKINPVTEIGQLFVPIGVQNAFNARQDPKEVLKGLPDVVGIGSQTYGTKDINISDKQKATVSKLKDKNQQEAYTRFYQTVKVGPDRDKYSGDIKKALQDKDLEKAKTLAKEYNKKYDESFNDWRKKYGQFKDETLAKEYNSNKITSETLKRYAAAIKKGENP